MNQVSLAAVVISIVFLSTFDVGVLVADFGACFCTEDGDVCWLDGNKILGDSHLVSDTDYPKLQRVLIQLPNPYVEGTKFFRIDEIQNPQSFQSVHGTNYNVTFIANGYLVCNALFFVGKDENAKPVALKQKCIELPL